MMSREHEEESAADAARGHSLREPTEVASGEIGRRGSPVYDRLPEEASLDEIERIHL